jgi:hypothetical protein
MSTILRNNNQSNICASSHYPQSAKSVASWKDEAGYYLDARCMFSSNGRLTKSASSYSATALSLPLIIGSWVVVIGSSRSRGSATASTSTLSVVLSPERSKSLLLGVRVDVCADDESNNIEEWNPCLLWQEFLRKCKAEGRRDPADLHYWPEASLDSCSDLVEGASTGDDGHEDEIN